VKAKTDFSATFGQPDEGRRPHDSMENKQKSDQAAIALFSSAEIA
jgi:hypothetical protein